MSRPLTVIVAACSAFAAEAQVPRPPDALAAAFQRPAPSSPAASDETVRRNLAAARRFVEDALGKGDARAFDELVADDVWVSSGLKPDAPIRGKAEYGQVLARTIGSALSNGRLQIDEAVPTPDGRVLVRFTAEADHTGSVDGIEASGRRLTLAEMHLLRFRDGRIVENLVGALNPLQWEMLFAPAIAPRVLPNASLR